MEHLILGDLLEHYYWDYFREEALSKYIDWTRDEIAWRIKGNFG